MDEKNIVKTGTTILGIVCKDGIVMAGDNRASLGNTLVGGKDLQKVLRINDYLLVAIAGHATEATKASKLLAAELRLKQLRSKKRPSIKEAASLLSNVQVQHSGFLVGGVEENGEFALYEIIGGLSTKISDFSASIGSGLMYVYGYLERMWKKEVSVKEGIELAKESIKSSMERDFATGNGMNIFTITKDGIKEVVKDKTELTFTKRE